MWERILTFLADRGIAWAQRALEERAARDRAESERIHAEVQEAERRRLVDP